MKPTHDKRQPEPSEGFNVGDIYYVLFRQKWIILTFAVLGFVAAGVVSVLKPAQYESEAKLYVQYVETVKTTTHANAESQTMSADSDRTIVANELEFLRSLDVAQKVVVNIGADKILEKYGGGEDTNAAAGVILKSLITDEIPKTPSSFRIAVLHPDGEMAREILRSFVDVYKNKSALLHNTQEDPEELTNEITRLRREVQETQGQLSATKLEAGIISTPQETKRGLSDRFLEINRKLQDAELDAADAGVTLDETEKPAPRIETPTNITEEASAPKPSDEKIHEYKSAVKRISIAIDNLDDARGRYPKDSPMLEPYLQKKKQFEDELTSLEQQYPQIKAYSRTVSTTTAQQQSGSPVGTVMQSVVVMQSKARIVALNIQIDRVKADLKKVESKEQTVIDLQNQLDGKNAALKHSEELLEVAKNHGSQEFVGGIKEFENPTPAVKKRSKQAKKLIMGALAGGVFGGLALAFLIEMVLDQSVKRPGEIEKKLRLPLFISIPDVNGDAHRSVPALAAHNRLLLNDANAGALVTVDGLNGGEPAQEIAFWDSRHSLHRFYSGLRDRLIVNFEVRNLNHNPKLVGVTSCNKGAGVSTVAAGLAASLSETGDGNVLLVDMRGDQGAAQQFHKGKPVGGIDSALGSETKNGAFMQDDFHVEGADLPGSSMPSVLSKRFASLMPKLKASDYDYIVFDMPPVSQTSMTARLSGLMDMVLLVIESEKTNRDSVKRATALLNESKAHVSTVLNKVHAYVPTRLHQEYLDDEA